MIAQALKVHRMIEHGREELRDELHSDTTFRHRRTSRPHPRGVQADAQVAAATTKKTVLIRGESGTGKG